MERTQGENHHPVRLIEGLRSSIELLDRGYPQINPRPLPQGRKKAGGDSVMMNDDQAIELVVQQTVATALELPCRDALNLLRGLLVLGGEHAALDHVRKAYKGLSESELQLELLVRK
jgi:hypothetical protein